MSQPGIVSHEEWQAARAELLVKEKAATRALDALAAERRRLPMTAIRNDYRFEGPSGELTLLDLFDGRRQLVIYHFMPPADVDHVCPGCTAMTDNVTAIDRINERDTSYVLTSGVPLERIEAIRARTGWTVPWFAALDPEFAVDFGLVGPDGGQGFGLSVLLRDGTDIYRTYFTGSRGVDRLRFDYNVLDLTPYGRQEDWEDSPPGWPQRPTYG